MSHLIVTALVSLFTFIGATLTIPTPTIWDEAPLRFGATNFPSSLDSLTNPSGTDSVATVSHSGQHSNANDAIEAIEAKVGTGASTPVTDSIFVGDGTGTSRYSTWATTTRFTATNFLANGSTTLQTFTFTNATGTSATTTNSFATNASSTNLSFVTGTGNSLSLMGNVTATGISSFSQLLATSSTTLQNWTGINSTTTNATTTNLRVSNLASTTNLIAVSGTFNSITTSSCTGCGSLTNAVTLVPRPVMYPTATTTLAVSSETTMSVGQVVITSPIVVNKLTIQTGDDFAGNYTLFVSVYSENGQTRHISVSQAITAANQEHAIAVSSVTLEPGIYYMAVSGSENANNTIHGWNTNNFQAFGTVSSEPTLEGTVTITADTHPATITPTSITSSPVRTAIFRLDN